MRNAVFFILSVQIFWIQVIHAQHVTGHSPITRYGLGSSWGLGISRNDAMAGCGLAAPHQDQPNLANPSLLPFTEKVNLNADVRYIYHNVKVGNLYQYENGGGGPSNFSVNIPFSPKYAMAFGIRPFSNRDFLFTQTRFVGGDSIEYASRGSGGTAQAFLSAGYRINDYISVGLEAGYVFGTLEDSVKFGSIPVSNNFTFITLNKRKVSQFTFKPGINIRFPIRKDDNQYLSLGSTLDLNPTFQYRNYQTFVVKGTGSAQEQVDNGSKGTIQRPTSLSFGLSWYKMLFWSLSLEGDYWRGKGVNNEEGAIVYRDGYSLRLGGEFSPGTKKSTAYFNIITFRAGAGFSRLPYTVDGKSIQEQYVSAGASFPIIRKEAKYSRPLLNLSVAYGQTGNLESSVGREQFVRVIFGITLNDFLWFNRYRVD